MKDYTINGWSLRFDNGTARIIREARGVTTENAFEGVDSLDMAPWIIYGATTRARQRGTDTVEVKNLEDAKILMDDLNQQETIDIINAYVKAMSVVVDSPEEVTKEGQEQKKS